MAKQYNGTYQIQAFKVSDIITMAILAKDCAVNDFSRIKVEIIAIPHEN